MNLGLRYEYFGQLLENYGAQSNFVPSPTAGWAVFRHSSLTNKRCNTPFSADFHGGCSRQTTFSFSARASRDWAYRKRQTSLRGSGSPIR